MKRPHAVLVVLVLFAALSGCLADAPTDTAGDPSSDAPTVPERIAFEGCREVLGLWELDWEEAEPYLPNGFISYSMHHPSENNVGRNASMHLLGITCTDPVEISLLFPWIPVVPPDALGTPDADVFRVMMPCIGSEHIVSTLKAWGVPCIAGDAAVVEESSTPASATWAFEAKSAQFDVRVEGTGVATGLMSDEPVFRLFHAIDGDLCAITHLELEDHEHWEGQAFTIDAEGEVPFPTPSEPTDGLLAMPDFTMAMYPVEVEGFEPDARCPEKSDAGDQGEAT